MEEKTPAERIALIVWMVATTPGGVTVTEVAQKTGTSWDTAHGLLERISRIIPIYENTPHNRPGVGIRGKPVKWCAVDSRPLGELDDGG